MRTSYGEGLYGIVEARNLIKSGEKAIARADEEMLKSEQRADGSKISGSIFDALNHEFASLRRTNLESASFDDKLQLKKLLDLNVYPSVDLKTVRVRIRLSSNPGERSAQNDNGKILVAPPVGTIPRTNHIPSQNRFLSSQVFSIISPWLTSSYPLSAIPKLVPSLIVNVFIARNGVNPRRFCV